MNRLTGSAARAWIILALVFAAVFGSSVAASAATLSEPVAAAQMVSAPVPAAVGGGVVKADSSDDNQAVNADLSIPMFRWMGATQSFNYQTDGNPVFAAARASERTVYYGLPMMIGNTMWLASSSLLDGAVGFKPMNIVGLQIDQAAAKVGTAIIASPLLSAAFIMVALGTVVGLKRGERPWRRVWTTSLIAAIFVIMVAGSANSTQDGDTYKPGVGSPGWFLTAISSTTAEITSTVADKLTIPDFDPNGSYLCGSYVQDVIKSGTAEKKAGSTAPMSSALWVQTGLEAWKMAQFGDNMWTRYTYCHVLDWQYPVKAKAILDASGKYAPNANVHSAALSPSTGDQRDRSGIAWAACYWSPSSQKWDSREAFFTKSDDGTLRWGKKDSKDTVDGDNDEKAKYDSTFCNDWWTKDAKDWDSDKFRVGPNANDVTDFVGDLSANYGKQDLLTFLNNWQGADNSGIAVTISYGFSSFIISLVFLVVAAAIFFVNIAIVVCLLSIFVVLLVVLFSKNDIEGRLIGFVKNLIGLIVFSSVASLLIAAIATITQALGTVGKEIFSGVPVAMMLWTGLSPLFALIMLHFVFTKLLRVPSPFKLSSALAWGAAAGAAGGAAGAGITNAIQRGENRAEGAVKRAPGAAARGLKNAMSGKKSDGRDGAATPVGENKSSSRESVNKDGTAVEGDETPQTAVERREKAKAEKAEYKQARAEIAGEQTAEEKNAGYLSKLDRLTGGKGELMGGARTGWRGAVNKVAGKDVLSDRDPSKKGIAGNAFDGASDALASGAMSAGRNLRAVPEQVRKNAKEARARYAEMWSENKGQAIKQTLKTGAKYTAIGLASIPTAGGAAAAYGAYRVAKSGVRASADVRATNKQSALDLMKQKRIAAEARTPSSAPQTRTRNQGNPSQGGGQPKPAPQPGGRPRNDF